MAKAMSLTEFVQKCEEELTSLIGEPETINGFLVWHWGRDAFVRASESLLYFFDVSEPNTISCAHLIKRGPQEELIERNLSLELSLADALEMDSHGISCSRQLELPIALGYALQYSLQILPISLRADGVCVLDLQDGIPSLRVAMDRTASVLFKKWMRGQCKDDDLRGVLMDYLKENYGYEPQP